MVAVPPAVWSEMLCKQARSSSGPQEAGTSGGNPPLPKPPWTLQWGPLPAESAGATGGIQLFPILFLLDAKSRALRWRVKSWDSQGPLQLGKRGHCSQILPDIVQSKFLARLFTTGVIQRSPGGADGAETPGFVSCCASCAFLLRQYDTLVYLCQCNVLWSLPDLTYHCDIHYLSWEGSCSLLFAETQMYPYH